MSRKGKPLNKFHKHLFDKEKIIQMLEKNGFEIEKFLDQPFPNIFIHHLGKYLNFINRVSLKSKRRFEFLSRFVAYPYRFLNKFTYSFVIVAKKK